MPLSELIQKIIHLFEVGAGARYLRCFTLALAILAVGFLYDLRAYRNFSAPEAMDAAQVARNISEGNGFTTQFIRPFSLYLIQQHNETEAKIPAALTNTNLDLAQIKTNHPDLANPPVYPLVLAGLMKVLPFDYPVNLNGSFWGNAGKFWRYEPDYLIAIFNEILLLVVAVMTFFLARKLFDSSVAWLSAVLVFGCELLWRFSSSGLSTILLIIIFLGLTRLLLQIEKRASEPDSRAGNILGMAIAAGVITGVGALTRYAFGWTIIPVVLFLLFFGPKRFYHALAAFAAFAIILTPWIIRNEMISGTAFGTAGVAISEGTFVFPQFKLERSLHPQLSQALWLTPYAQKFVGNAREIFTTDIFKIGSSWLSVLFFAGLFLRFRSSSARRIRHFLLMCLGVFIVAQALGKTQLSVISPEINSENLLALLVPLVFVFGASFFFTLLEQMALPILELRYAIVGIFAGLCCLPMIFALLPPKSSPVVYPPYFPPEIQQIAGWMKPSELIMSDAPWAVAWYGDRQCVWLSLDAQTEFFAINRLKPVQALYLTPETMDGKFVSDWVHSGAHSWGNFIINALIKDRIPSDFPLHRAPTGFMPDRMFLTDRQRWETAAKK
ncbi:MAG: hypothetical protein ACREFE_08635 [Limisphaerales bacterium]